MKNRITLKPAPHKRAMLENRMRYDVMLDGRVFDTLYYNMTGYVGTLPLPDGGRLSIGETTLKEYRTEICKLNLKFNQPKPCNNNPADVINYMAEQAEEGTTVDDLIAELKTRFTSEAVLNAVGEYGTGFNGIPQVYEDILGRCDGPLPL
jgi:hypothetical protein